MKTGRVRFEGVLGTFTAWFTIGGIAAIIAIIIRFF